MGKVATSRKPRRSAAKSLRVYEPFANKELKDARLVSEALLDCIKSGDTESFREVLVSFLMTANKAKIAKKAGIGRRTLYDLIDPKKAFNPELSTVAAVIRALAA
jgi:DNA-binding phage protein